MPIRRAGDGYEQYVIFSDTMGQDAFGRTRVSNPQSIHASQLQYDAGPLFWNEKITGGSVTHLPNESSARLRITGANQSVLRQSKAYHRYQAGKSQNPTVSFVAKSAEVGLTIELGYGDDENGIFYRIIDGVPNFTLRSKSSGVIVDTNFPQTEWSEDKFNGEGSSRINLEMLKSQIFVPDLEWLGVGRVRCCFNIDGKSYEAHVFNNANIKDRTYMTTANLPIRYKISSDGTLGAGTYDLIQICNDVSSDGGQELELGNPFAISNGITEINVSTRRPILSIRPKALFNSITNRGLIEPLSYKTYSEDAPIFVELVYGGTLTNASFNSVHDHSIVEYDIAATAISGGIPIDMDIIAASATGSNVNPSASLTNLLSKYPMFLDIDGNHPTTPFTDILSLVTTAMTASASDVSGILKWLEIR